MNVKETIDFGKKEKIEESTVLLKVRMLSCSLSTSNLWRIKKYNILNSFSNQVEFAVSYVHVYVIIFEAELGPVFW